VTLILAAVRPREDPHGGDVRHRPGHGTALSVLFIQPTWYLVLFILVSVLIILIMAGLHRPFFARYGARDRARDQGGVLRAASADVASLASSPLSAFRGTAPALERSLGVLSCDERIWMYAEGLGV